MRWSLGMRCPGNPRFALKLTVALASGEVNSRGRRRGVGAPASSGRMAHGLAPGSDGRRPLHVPRHALPEPCARAPLARRAGGGPRVVPPALAQPARHAAPLRLARDPLDPRPPVPLPAPPLPPAALGGAPAPLRARDAATARPPSPRDAAPVDAVPHAGPLRAPPLPLLDVRYGRRRPPDRARRDRVDARLHGAPLLVAAQAR